MWRRVGPKVAQCRAFLPAFAPYEERREKLEEAGGKPRLAVRPKEMMVIFFRLVWIGAMGIGRCRG